MRNSFFLCLVALVCTVIPSTADDSGTPAASDQQGGVAPASVTPGSSASGSPTTGTAAATDSTGAPDSSASSDSGAQNRGFKTLVHLFGFGSGSQDKKTKKKKHKHEHSDDPLSYGASDYESIGAY